VNIILHRFSIGCSIGIDTSKIGLINRELNMSNSKEKFVGGVFCMDGRGRGPIEKHTGKYVDDVAGSGPGTVRGVANREDRYIESLRVQIPVSVLRHGSKEIWISGHAECAGNPVEKEEHIAHMQKAAGVVQDVLFELGKGFENVKVKLIWTYPDIERVWKSEVIE
jgi:hypothetical protein